MWYCALLQNNFFRVSFAVTVLKFVILREGYGALCCTVLRSSAETVFSFVKIFVLENLCPADLLTYSRLCFFHPYKNAGIDIGCRAGSSNRTSQAWLRVYCSNPFLSSIHRFSPNFSFHYPLSLPRFRTNGLKEMLSSLSIRLPNHYINCVT